MSADLDAIALAAAKAVYPYGPATYCWGDDAKNDAARERDWKAIAKRISLTAGFTDAVTEAIAQDRKTRIENYLSERHCCSGHECGCEGVSRLEWAVLEEAGTQIAGLRKQLAQQSAALASIGTSLNLAGGHIESAISSGYHGFDNGEDCQQASVHIGNALAQLAEAPRVEPRALTSGEAVEALLKRIRTFITVVLRWQIIGVGERAEANEIIRSIDALRAPSRTEREDTAPEVGGKGGV